MLTANADVSNRNTLLEKINQAISTGDELSSFESNSLAQMNQENYRSSVQFNTHLSKAEYNLFDNESVEGYQYSHDFSSEVLLFDQEEKGESSANDEKNFKSIYFDELDENRNEQKKVDSFFQPLPNVSLIDKGEESKIIPTDNPADFSDSKDSENDNDYKDYRNLFNNHKFQAASSKFTNDIQDTETSSISRDISNNNISQMDDSIEKTLINPNVDPFVESRPLLYDSKKKPILEDDIHDYFQKHSKVTLDEITMENFEKKTSLGDLNFDVEGTFEEDDHSVIKEIEKQKVDIPVPYVDEETSQIIPFSEDTFRMRTWQREAQEKAVLFSPGTFFGGKSCNLGDLGGTKPENERPVFFMPAKPDEANSAEKYKERGDSSSSSLKSSPLNQKMGKYTALSFTPAEKGLQFRINPDIREYDLGILHVGNYESTKSITIENIDSSNQMYAYLAFLANTLDDLDAIALDASITSSLIQYNTALEEKDLVYFSKIHRVVIPPTESVDLHIRVRPLNYSFNNQIETKNFKLILTSHHDGQVETLSKTGTTFEFSYKIGHSEILLPDQYKRITIQKNQSTQIMMYNNGNISSDVFIMCKGRDLQDFYIVPAKSFKVQARSFHAVEISYFPRTLTETSRIVMILEQRNGITNPIGNIEIIGENSTDDFVKAPAPTTMDMTSQTQVSTLANAECQTNFMAFSSPSYNLRLSQSTLMLSLQNYTTTFQIYNDQAKDVQFELLYSPSIINLKPDIGSIKPFSSADINVSVLPASYGKMMKAESGTDFSSTIIVSSNREVSNCVQVQFLASKDAKSTIMLPLTEDKKVSIDFPSTFTFASSLTQLLLFNFSNEKISWKIKKESHVFSSFKWTSSAGDLEPSCWSQIAISFEPLKSGSHNEKFLLKQGKHTILLEVNAASFYSASTENQSQERIKERLTVENRKPWIEPKIETQTIKPFTEHNQKVAKTSRFKPQDVKDTSTKQTIVFIPCKVGHKQTEKIKICNSNNEKAIISIQMPEIIHPFEIGYLESNSFNLEPKSHIYLPLSFRPDKVGRYEIEFTVRSTSPSINKEKLIRIVLRGAAK